MKIVLLILQIIVAIVFLIAGLLKLTNSYKRLIPENKLEKNTTPSEADQDQPAVPDLDEEVNR